MTRKSLILFDGVCNLCNGLVNFIIPRDPHGQFQFASLQSESAKALLDKFGYSASNLSTVVLIEEEKLFAQSTAVLRILRRLGGGWRFFYPLIILPRWFRDFFYDLIARNRYRLFGKKDSCMVPTAELRARFLE